MLCGKLKVQKSNFGSCVTLGRLNVDLMLTEQSTYSFLYGGECGILHSVVTLGRLNVDLMLTTRKINKVIEARDSYEN